MKNMKRIHKVVVKRMYDTDADFSYLEQEGFEDRRQALLRDEFGFIGILAEAEISVSRDERPDSGYLTQTITSGGLWSIESDSDKDYLKSVEDEELSELRTQLVGVGFSQRAITAAFRNVEQGGDAR